MQEKNVSNSNFVIEDGVLLNYTGTESIVKIPSDVIKIGVGAFENAEISEIVFSYNTLQSIENDAFKRCHNLECIELPEGLINIGENAFYACSKLKCVYVPSSVLVIEDDAFDLCSSDLFLIGKKNSEAEKFATEKRLGFRTDKTKALTAFKSAIQKTVALESRTFNVFGESVTCSNSLPLYVEVTNRYDKIKPKTSKEVISYLPQDLLSDPKGDIEKILEKPIKQAIEALQKEGIVIEKNHALLAVSSDYINVCNNLVAVIKCKNIILEKISQNIDYKVADLKHDIERQVTGLSYGVIGDRLDVLAHSIDDMRERAYQRGKATAIANNELDNYKSKQQTEGNRIYQDYITNQTPTINDAVVNYVNKIKEWELSVLSSSGLLDLDAMKSIDCEKSMKLLESANHHAKDECAILALSIKKYPYNISAISRIFAKKYDSQGLTELVDFLGISNDVKKCIPKERKNYISSCEKAISRQTTLGSALAFYSDIKTGLTKSEKKAVLEKVTENNTKKVCNLLASRQLSHIKDIKVFVDEEMDKIIDESQWDFITSEGICPVQSSKIPPDISAQRNTLVQYINSELTKLQSSHLEYEAYLNKYPILKKADELEGKRLDLINQRHQIEERKEHCKKGRLKAFLAVTLGVLALSGITIPVIEESFLLLGIIMGVIGLLGAIISLVDISEYSKYMSAQSIKETKTMEQKYQKELKTYNNEIDKMNAVPKFKGNISSNKKVKIPSRIDEN